MDEVPVFRRAVLSDRDSVMAIHDNVFEGSDYLPAFYNRYMEDKAAYCFLAEVNGKVVAFNIRYVTHGGTRVIAGGGRTNPAFQRKGIISKLGAFGNREVARMFPQLRCFTWASNFQSTADKIEGGLTGARIVMSMNFLYYKTSNSALRVLSQNCPEGDNAVLTETVDDLLLSASNRRALFPESLIKYQSNWMILQATDDTIQTAANVSYTVVTKKKDDEILAVSFGCLVPTPKLVFRYDLDLYVDTAAPGPVRDKACISHIIAHMKHAADCSKPGEYVGMFLTLPCTCNLRTVKSLLKPYLGDNVKSDFFSGESSFVFERNFDPPAIL